MTIEAARRLLLERPPFWSGIEGIVLDGPLAKAFNVPQTAGLLLQKVAKDSPAEKLGLRHGTLEATIDGKPLLIGGDILLKVQGIPIIGDLASYKLIRERGGALGPGDTITVEVLRGGEKREFKLDIPTR